MNQHSKTKQYRNLPIGALALLGDLVRVTPSSRDELVTKPERVSAFDDKQFRREVNTLQPVQNCTVIGFTKIHR